MAEIQDKRREYYIPDNFIHEGCILQGRIKIRNLIEAAVLALPFALAALAVTEASAAGLQGRISIFICFCAPPLICGVLGFNGEGMFSLIRNFRHWRSESSPMLYNRRPVLLRMDIVEEHFSETRRIDGVLDRREGNRRKRIEDKEKMTEYLGRDIRFEEDPDVSRYTRMNREKEERRRRTAAEEYGIRDIMDGEAELF